MEFSRQKYWRRLPFPTPEDLPQPRLKPASPVSPALEMDSLPLCYLGSPREPHTKTIEQINEFNKVAGYKVNIQKSVAFPYTDNEISETGSKKITPFKIIFPPKKKTPMNKLNQGNERLNAVSYKTLMKETERDAKK